MKNIIAFNADDTGCGHYRIKQPYNHLQEVYLEEFSCTIRDEYISDEWFDKGRLKYDAFVFQRQMSSVSFNVMDHLRKMGIPSVYEIDDNLFEVSIFAYGSSLDFNKISKEGQENLTRLTKAIQRCDYLTVSTEPLKEQLSHLHHNIHVLRNYVDLDLYTPYMKKEYDPETIVIGWGGSATHFPDMPEVSQALKDVVKMYDNVKLAIMGWPDCEFFTDVDREKYIEIPWSSLEEYPKMVSQFDIGVCPLIDTKFNQAKSNLKYIEYGALGIPAICSKVYPYSNTITEGENGILVKAKGAVYRRWVAALCKLIEDVELRKKLGTNARKLVEQQYCKEAAIEDWYNFYNEIL